jgi:hypothetical protein
MARTEINTVQILDGTVLLADLSSEVLNKLIPNVRTNIYAYESTVVTLTSGNTKTLFQSESVDSQSEFISSQFKSKFIQNILVSGYISVGAVTANKNYYVQVYKNGISCWKGDITRLSVSGKDIYLPFNVVVDVIVNDTIEIWVNSEEAGKQILTGQSNTFIKILNLV